MFQNKKILFVCRETYSKPLWFVARDYLAAGNEVAAFFIMSSECSYRKCYYNVNTYYRFKEELPGLKLYDVRDICDRYTEGLKQKDVPYDPGYLDEIERTYTHFKNLNMQLMCSQENTRHYHWRYYWKVTTYEENLFWLELNYKKILQIFDEFGPDMILDFDNAELQRTIINEVAYVKGVPYITVEYSKFGYYKYPTFQNTIGIDDYVREAYERNLKKDRSQMEESYAYIEDYRSKSTIMNKEFSGTVTAQYKRDSYFWILRVMRGKLHYFWNMDITAGNLKLKRSNPLLYAPSFPYIRHYLQTMLVRRKYMGPNKLFEAPVPGEDYVYMPLHLIPESTVFVKASYYVDELNLIEQVSKSLPIGWKLYVKEHQAMLGERGIDFYKKVKELHNVRLVQVNAYHDPKPWITGAKGVVTIVGTTAFEEALLGRRSVIFGDVPFELIDGIDRVKDFEELPGLIRNFGEIDNMHSCAAYLETIKEIGVEIDLFYLMDEADRVLGKKTDESEKFRDQIRRLEEFYDKGYAQYQKGKKPREVNQ
ncbi:MAG: hypothetical protein IKS87_03380 [Lachnospiraceae bacterium]|nr:hypothetical protein [Lachnospiraceae bacterium]